MKHRLGALLATATLAACGNTVSDEVINGQAVATVQQSNANFSQYTTFTVANTVQVHDNTTGNANDSTKDATTMAAQVRSLMEARGYTYVTYAPGAQADLVIAFDAFLNSTTYGGYYCNWYYWGYAYGCGYYYSGTYKYGTLVMQMGDLKNAITTPAPQINTAWAAAMYGLLGSDAYNLQIVTTSIDRAFAQSPYLHK